MPTKVLLVDDEKEFTRALAERLRHRGFDVTTAASGPEALTRVKDERFDALVLDFSMPGMDGFETFTHLHETQPHLQVIFLTGHATVTRGVEAMKMGAMDFLVKPIDVQEIAAKLEQAKRRTRKLDAQETAEHIAEIVETKPW